MNQKLIYHIVIILPVLAGSIQCVCQVPAQGDLRQFIDNKISNLPKSGSNEYMDPASDDLVVWEEAISALLSNNLSESHDLFSEIDYQVIVFTNSSDGNEYYIIDRKSGASNYWGIYILNPNPCRNQLIIQSPHPIYDTNTGYQGLYTFIELDAKALFISGTHRCNSGVASSCSGTTSACGASDAFRISDQAHNTESIFQLMTEIFSLTYPESIFVQFHGFGKQNGDPNAIMSNGSRQVPSDDYIAQLVDEMKSDNPGLTFKVGHIDTNWSRLLAFTNTQGRLINGSVTPCNANASGNSGRFIHIEQEKEIFRENESGWVQWIGPMSRVFKCESDAPLSAPIKIPIYVYPNPSSSQIQFRGLGENCYLWLIKLSGEQLALGEISANSLIDLSSFENGIYGYQILDKDNTVIYRGKILKQ